MGNLLPHAPPLRSAFERDCFVIVPHALPAPLVERWRRRAMEMIAHARTITRREGALDLVYRVVTGDAIRNHWPELFAFYEDAETVAWVREVTGSPEVRPSDHLVSAVNLNIMDSTQAIYRWHFDAVPYTLLIYLTDTLAHEGGALEMVPGCASHEAPDLAVAAITRCYPAAGSVVLMNGTRCYHRVAPMQRATMRLSIPLVYPNAGASRRPVNLDAYLYKEAG